MWDAITSIVNTVSRFLSKNTKRPDGSKRHPESIASASPVTILAVLGAVSDRQLLNEVSRRAEWRVSFASTVAEARESFKRVKPQVIVLDRDMDGTDWRSAVSLLSAASGGACVLLISRVIDDYLWNEVVTNGGYDILRKPLSENDVVRNVKLAWSYWSGTRQPAGIKK
ncbi:MAG TPA: response regulator [Bryobacteraceae bacterium]|nr:response regulator [Bryobacteraceae bacterium]